MKKTIKEKFGAVRKLVAKNYRYFLAGSVGMGILVPLLAYGAFWVNYKDRVYPGVRAGAMSLQGMRGAEAVNALAQKELLFGDNHALVLEIVTDRSASESAVFSSSLSDLGVSYKPSLAAENALAVGRGGSFWANLVAQWRGLIYGVELAHEFEFDEIVWAEFVDKISEEVDRPGAPAAVRWLEEPEDGSNIEVFLGEDGLVLDKNDVKEQLEDRLSRLNGEPIGLSLTEENNKITEEIATVARGRAEGLTDRELTVSVEVDGPRNGKTWKLTAQDLVAFIDVDGGYLTDKLEEYVSSLAVSVNREAQNALFRFEGGKVIEFAPGLDGIVVDERTSVERLSDALAAMEAGEDKAVSLAVNLTAPALRTPEVNDLGIKELLGKGLSTYRGSIPGRVHNVALTASRLHGILIPPGEVFSFNGTIGDVSTATGYKSAYVIKDGRTVLGDGGGVCQDSTTLFRAILDAGLPIVERRAHSYRVGYYEQNQKPGFDATVYAPSVDLKFKNDTPAHILIQARADSRNLTLTVEFYGTDDGRVASVKNYQKWGSVPAPPPLYQDDPTLPAGVVKQVDWAAAGLKTKFDYVVTRSGETVFEKTFYSNFRPWQAVYLRGTG